MTVQIQNPSNANEWVDLSSTGIENIPVQYGLPSALGLFTPEYGTSSDWYLPIVDKVGYALVDTPYNTRSQNITKDKKKRLKYEIPHFSVEGAIFPSDVKQKIAWEDFMFQSRSETVAGLFDREKETAAQAIQRTKDLAMYQLIRDGSVYAPNGTVVNNLYTAFGVTQTALNLDLTPTGNPKASVIAALDDIAANFKGGYVPSRYVAFTNKAVFDALEAHPLVMDNAKNILDFQSIQILTGLLGTAAPSGASRNQYRAIDYAGVLWIRVSDTEIPANQVRLFPIDVPNMFKISYAPSELTFDTVNTTALEQYYWEKVASDRTQIQYIYESNFAAITPYPKSIVRLNAVYA